MAPQFSSFLTSPTIRLLPNPPAAQPCSDTQYIVHRALLTAQSPYLKKRTRESYILLENTTEETVGLFLEWLYRGDYDVPTSAIDEQEEESAEPEQGPVVQAAMAGAVGVWGKKAAQFGRSYTVEKAQSEGLKSLYVKWEANGEVTVKGAKPENTTNGITKPSQLPSPPASPTLSHGKPQYSSVNGLIHISPQGKATKPPAVVSISLPQSAPEPATPQQSNIDAIVTLSDIIASHLAVHVFAIRYQVQPLAHLSLAKLSGLLQAHPPTADELVKLIRATYYDSEETGNFAGLTKGGHLRSFLTKYSTFRLEEVKGSAGFKKLLAEGGEFVVDLVGCVMGGAGKNEIWVK